MVRNESIIPGAEVADYAHKGTAARRLKRKDVVENVKWYGWVLAWSIPLSRRTKKSRTEDVRGFSRQATW